MTFLQLQLSETIVGTNEWQCCQEERQVDKESSFPVDNKKLFKQQSQLDLWKYCYLL